MKNNLDEHIWMGSLGLAAATGLLIAAVAVGGLLLWTGATRPYTMLGSSVIIIAGGALAGIGAGGLVGLWTFDPDADRTDATEDTETV